MTEDVHMHSVAEWLDISILILAACLHLRINSYLAESRILRKLQNPVRKRIGEDLKEETVERRFAELVLGLCKGDNRRSGRMVNRGFDWFYVSASLLQLVVPNLKVSDSYLALAVPVLVRSFLVIGAGVLKKTAVLLNVLASLSYGCLLYLSSTDLFVFPATMRTIAYYILWVAFSLFVLDLAVEFYSEWRGSDDHLFCVAQAIMKNRVNEAQRSRLLKMTELMHREEFGQEAIRERTTRRRLMDFIVFPMSLWATVILYNNSWMYHNVAREVALEVLELLFVFMSFANDTHVEPRVFVKLLKHAHDLTGKENFQESKSEPGGEASISP